MFPKSLAAA